MLTHPHAACARIQGASKRTLRSTSAALAWLHHCQCYGLEDCVEICELEIGRRYLQVARDDWEDLQALTSSSLFRINQMHASFMCAPNPGRV